MDLNKFAKEVHENAVAHGWWEEERDIFEILALIHSEWSEALEEYRADRPMVWYECIEARQREPVVCSPKDEYDCLSYSKLINGEGCPHRGRKPEGVAVELIDGCIRILDLAGKFDYEGYDTVSVLIRRFHIYNQEFSKETPLPIIVAMLHRATAAAGNRIDDYHVVDGLKVALACAFYWLSENGLDPEELMRTKHEYNKTRPYKHGKKC